MLEKPDRKGRVGAGVAKEIAGRIDFIVPQGRGTTGAWTIQDGNVVAVSLTGATAHKHPELLVLSLPPSVARNLRDDLNKVLGGCPACKCDDPSQHANANCACPIDGGAN